MSDIKFKKDKTDEKEKYNELLFMLNDFETEENEEQKEYYELISSRNLHEYDTTEEFDKHQRTIRQYIIDEYESKMFYRKFSFWSIIGITFSLLVFIYLFLFFKSSSTPISFLITLTLSVFANLMALIGIVFKYVFSSTTEITDYAKALSEQEYRNNNK